MLIRNWAKNVPFWGNKRHFRLECFKNLDKKIIFVE